MATNGGARKFNKNKNNWLHKHFEHQQVDVVVSSLFRISILYQFSISLISYSMGECLSSNVERSSTVTHASKYNGRANVGNTTGSSASFFIKHFSAVYKHPGPMT